MTLTDSPTSPKPFMKRNYGVVAVSVGPPLPHERSHLLHPGDRERTIGLNDDSSDARQFFVIVKPATVTSVLCAKRIPYTPSVDLSFPAVTSAALA
jgi:hypothetical protein